LTDTRTPEQRSRIMAAVKSRDTKPELALRRALFELGVRGWRVHYRGASGTPDIAWPRLKIAVFVDGAFWHGHPSRHKPGRSGSYWDRKIATNIERDRRVDSGLESDGWLVIRIWDFEVRRDLPHSLDRILTGLRSRVPRNGTARWERLVHSLPAPTGDDRQRRASRPVSAL
jgi:DNA mismatch endonuclease, patch repair protein